MNLGAHYQLVKSIFEASSNFNNKKPRVKRAKEKSMNKHDSFFSYIKQAHPTIFSKVPIFALMCFFTEKVAKWKVVTLHKYLIPSFINSWSIRHILEHVFFWLAVFAAQGEKNLYFWANFEGGFFNFFKNIVASAIKVA